MSPKPGGGGVASRGRRRYDLARARLNPPVIKKLEPKQAA